MASTEQRVHAVCDRYVDDYAAADPVTATMQGIAGHDDRLTDYSPDGYARRGELAARARAEVTATEPGDVSERSAQAVFTERLGVDLELHEAGLDLAQLNVIASPPQDMRMAFDLMATETADDWAVISARLTGERRRVAPLPHAERDAHSQRESEDREDTGQERHAELDPA